MSNSTFKTIEEARSHFNAYKEDFDIRVESRVADRLKLRFSIPPPHNTINQRELDNLISEEIRKEIYGA